MKYLNIVAIILIIVGCTQDEHDFHNKVMEYQGYWRDTTYINNEIYTEEFIVDNYTMEYTLSNAATHIVHDKQNGIIVLGKENKLGWYCNSPINNMLRQTIWDVHKLSSDQLNIYSPLQGEHEYKRAFRASLDENTIKDTINEFLQYRNYLPMSKSDLINKFGSPNILKSEKEISYLLNHPIFKRITFKENYDNDSIYSYTLSIKDETEDECGKSRFTNVNWQQCEQLIDSIFTEIRLVGGVKEYCDNDLLENSTYVILVDTALHEITFSPLRDYNYWPEISHYIDMPLQIFMNDYESEYVYRYFKEAGNGLKEHDFMTEKDGICSRIAAGSDTLDIIRYTGVILSEKFYDKSEIKKISHILDSKYYFGRYENSNEEKYYYYPSKNIEDSKFIVRLRIQYDKKYKEYTVIIEFSKLYQQSTF